MKVSRCHSGYVSSDREKVELNNFLLCLLMIIIIIWSLKVNNLRFLIVNLDIAEKVTFLTCVISTLSW